MSMFKPTQFGKYYLTERLAVGGMAEIFKAKLYGVSGFEKPMVVKQILPQYARNAEFIKMFIDEAKISVSLTHGNIIPVYELGRCDGVYFIAMEYMHGKDLAEILDEARAHERPLSVEHAVYIGIEICKGLDYAHRRTDAQGSPLGLVHRDVSPPNVMVTMSGDVKLTDFGIAKATHKLGSTEAGVVKGTYGYMSPEQLTGGEVDHRTDIFSCGILLHEMLTGQRLFAGGSELDAMERVKEARVPPPSLVCSRVPASLDPIVIKALAKEPADRFHDANELQLALSRALFGAGTGASATTLGVYMGDLFGQTSGGGGLGLAAANAVAPAASAGKVDNATRSYAARDVLEAAAVQSAAATPQQWRVTGAPPVDQTTALPALDHDDGDTQVDGGDIDDTAVFRPHERLQRPEVPELRFSVRTGLSAAAPAKGELFSSGDVEDALDVLDGTTEPSAPSRAARSGTRPGRPDSDGGRGATVAPPAAAFAKTAPIETSSVPATAGTRPPVSRERPPVAFANTERRPLTIEDRPAKDGTGSFAPPQPATSTRHSGLLNLFTKPPTEQHDALDHEDTGGRVVIEGTQRKRRPSTLNSTLSLFVQGIDGDEPASTAPLDPSQSYPALDGSIPRSIKPTVLGWIVIVAVLAGGGLFVLYKQTDVFSGVPDDSGSLLDLPAVPAHPEEKKPARADVIVSSEPAGGFILRHVGDAPVEIEADPGQTHVVRVEREGYRTAHQVVKPSDFVAGTATVTVTISPVGAGGKAEEPPEIDIGPPTGRSGKIKVLSDPPAASVWLLLGKSRATLSDAEAARYYFKVVLADHEAAFVTVLPREFENAPGGALERTARLESRGEPASGSEPAAKPDASATVEPAAVEQPRAEQPVVPVRHGAPAARLRRPAPVRRPPRARSSRRDRPREAKPREAKPREAKPKPAKPQKKLTLPSWAD